MKLVNLTKQPLVLHDTHGEIVEIPSDPRHLGVVALGEHRTVADDDGHTFSWNVRYVDEVKGMPAPTDDTLYVVPIEVAMVLQGERDDVVFPADVVHVRDAEGRLRRVTHLRRIVSRLG